MKNEYLNVHFKTITFAGRPVIIKCSSIYRLEKGFVSSDKRFTNDVFFYRGFTKLTNSDVLKNEFKKTVDEFYNNLHDKYYYHDRALDKYIDIRKFIKYILNKIK